MAANQGQGQGQQQQQPLHSYPPQQQYYAHPYSQSQSPYQQYQPYQPPPPQPQYYVPPQQPQYAPTSPPPGISLSAPPSQQQQQQQRFFAELEAPPISVSPNSRPTSSASASSPPDAPKPVLTASKDDAPVLLEMSAEPVTNEPATVRPTSAAGSASSAKNSTEQQKPLVQANPWGFFLPDDVPDRTASKPPTAPAAALPADELLAVKPLRIIKTGPSSNKPKPASSEVNETKDQPAGSGSGCDSYEGPAVQSELRPGQTQNVDQVPLHEQGLSTSTFTSTGSATASPDSPLAPAPLNITRPQLPAAQQPSVGPPASPVLVPPAGTYPPQSPTSPTAQHTLPGLHQMTLPIHPRPVSTSPPRPASATSASPAPASVAVPIPSHIGHSPQPQHVQPALQHEYTAPTPVSPIYIQPALPPSLPLGTYFPQQPSYAQPTKPAPPASFSPTISISSSTIAPYASPPPSYNQAVYPANLPTASPTPSQAQQYQPSTPAPLSPNQTGATVTIPHPYSPSHVGQPQPAHRIPSPANYQTYPYNPQAAAPPVPQPSYVNVPQGYQPAPPPLPPRTSPTPGLSQRLPPNPWGPPPPSPSRPNYACHSQSGPVKSSSSLFSSATARKLLNKTTDFVDQAITPYLQDNRYRPPYYPSQQYQYYQNPPPNSPGQGQYHQQQQYQQPQHPGYAPQQPTYAAPQGDGKNSDVQRPT
ncbi:hypothetical protein C8034_v001919 [Colletotrichum sidae]|uniref:Uncharacterized protein n=1 Tax=Colletotrichum sidae TaxID=1347389 RepID=A0A4V3I2R5_9PEZI|nr:hypothetical protein C8034_v001919 [Colletotrichum sidae]